MSFYHLCHQFLSDLAIKIEEFDTNSLLDVDYADGILHIAFGKQQFVINRNAGNEKIWYSSPISGPDYFAFIVAKNNWYNYNDIDLTTKLFNELKQILT